jgi:hypothetical protein
MSRLSVPLGIKQAAVYAGTVILFPFLAVALKVFGYKHISQFLTRTSPNPLVKSYPREHAIRIALMLGQVINAASARGLRQATCLERSMMLWWILRCLRISTNLRVGIRREDGHILAHAWLEFDGIVINDRGDIGRLYLPFADTFSPEKVGRFV